MAENNSFIGVGYSTQNVKVIIAQLLVLIFLPVNLLMIITFYNKDCFHAVARYILFAVMLHFDSFVLLISYILLMLGRFQITIPLWLCVIICNVTVIYMLVTPLTLTAMTLERYVAICMPLRHGELCSTRHTVHCILIIHSLSLFPCMVFLSAFLASAEQNIYKQHWFCSVEIFTIHKWQHHLKSALHEFYFLIMCIIIGFCYFKIMKVAKAASGENKKSTRKGLRTVALHAFQLLLCLIQLWGPFIEAALLHVDFMLFLQIRFMNYICFGLTPRCLSPLIYGFRDEFFFHALKKNIICFNLCKKKKKHCMTKQSGNLQPENVIY